VVHRRPEARHAEITMPCSRPISTVRIGVRPRTFPMASTAVLPATMPWSTAKLGLVISTLAAVVALVLDAATSIPAHVIVLTVMAVAFAASLHATTRRPLH
jgi:hypothetical protein